jgi:hypothetical protein
MYFGVGGVGVLMIELSWLNVFKKLLQGFLRVFVLLTLSHHLIVIYIITNEYQFKLSIIYPCRLTSTTYQMLATNCLSTLFLYPFGG